VPLYASDEFYFDANSLSKPVDRYLSTNQEVVMKSKTAQWILWAVAMVIFTALTLSGHWNWLSVAITAVAVIWYTVVPKTHSRQQ
jgi:cytoskeletal protein RodZ